METGELDVVLLKDGKEAVILEVYPDGFYVGYDSPENEDRVKAVSREEVEKVIWKYNP